MEEDQTHERQAGRLPCDGQGQSGMGRAASRMDCGTGPRGGRKECAPHGLVSLALRNRYPRPLDMLRAKVEARMSYEIIPCPIMGMITRMDCANWQRLPYVGSNALRVAVYRACRAGCIQYEG